MAGVTSRRKADELIQQGRVTLNGQVMRDLGTRALWGKDSIKVDGGKIQGPTERIYLMLNKPFGYISSLDDPKGRPLAVDLLKNIPSRVYSIGRLDFDSIGLLLFTNDGDFTHRMSHPKYHIPRTYKVTVEGLISNGALKSLSNGLQLEDGFSGTSKAVLLGKKGDKSFVRLTIAQGRNRMVRRMIEAVGYRVIQLMRTGFGQLELGDLKVGHYRQLDPEEIRILKKMVGLK
ncbi:pseudouridine synthase [Thermodesulfobacteriota bacterium]